MRTTAKLLATLLFAAFISINAKAQMGTGMDLKIGLGASASITSGTSPFSYGIGADLKVEWQLAPALAITASGGYSRLVARDNSTIPAYAYIPAVGGIKVYPVKGMFLQGFAGAGFGIKEGQGESFIFGGGTGFEWDNGLELGVRYEGNKQDSGSTTYQRTLSQYAVRLGYNF